MKERSKNGQKLITYEELSSIIERIGKNELTVLDVNRDICEYNIALDNKLKEIYPEEKRYSRLNYLSNLLRNYSNQEDSLLQLHVPYVNNKKVNVSFRKPTTEEKKSFKSDYIAVFRRKKVYQIS